MVPRLRGDTSYSFTAVVFNDTFNTCSQSVVVHTPEGIPSSTPSNVMIRTGGPGPNLTLTWLPPSYNDSNGNISHYWVSLKDSREGINARNLTVYERIYSEPYDASLSYSYSIAACTSRGCGPSLKGSYGKQLNADSGES